MPGPGPDKLHDELDALLDGRPVELTGELAPLAEAAGALRAELAALELDPEVADRHLERVLEGSGRVLPLPARAQPHGWELRRRVVAVALAAALVLAPATMASAAALPGQAMYPFKLAIEQLRVASVAWSPAAEAVERTRVADERLDELEQLIELRLFNRLPTAIEALEEAVVAARVAVAEAERDGARITGVAAELDRVKFDGAAVVVQAVSTVDRSLVPDGTREAIREAVDEAGDVLPVPVRQVQGAPKPPPTTAPPVTQPPSEPTVSTPEPTAPPPTPPPGPPTTQPPPSGSAPTTEPPPTTVAPPTTGPPPASGEQPGTAGRAGDAVPDPTVPAP
jgi:hypothetical protein